MGLIKEPKSIDLTINSKPWTKEELAEFRAIIQKRKEAKAKKNSKASKTSKKKQWA
jgi:hypothetical protein